MVTETRHDKRLAVLRLLAEQQQYAVLKQQCLQLRYDRQTPDLLPLLALAHAWS